MNSTHLPPLPKEGESGPQVCNTVQLYLAVLDDLSPEQVTLLCKHVETCSTCSEEFQLMNGATNLVGGLERGPGVFRHCRAERLQVMASSVGLERGIRALARS